MRCNAKFTRIFKRNIQKIDRFVKWNVPEILKTNTGTWIGSPYLCAKNANTVESMPPLNKIATLALLLGPLNPTSVTRRLTKENNVLTIFGVCYERGVGHCDPVDQLDHQPPAIGNWELKPIQ